MEKLEFTGERVIPEVNKNDLVFAEHMCRYLFAGQFAKGMTVLDVACGSGYGSSYLVERGAKKVVGLDNSPEAIEYAKGTYGKTGVEFLIADAENLPFDSGTFDVVVSFETIEHLKNQEKCLQEIKRVLKEDGLAIISTPNILVFPKGNIFHTKELSPEEFQELLSGYFKNMAMHFQHNVIASYIADRKGAEKKYDEFISQNLKLSGLNCDQHLYLIAIAGNKELPHSILNASVLFNDKEIKVRDQEIKEKNKQLKEIHNSRGWKIVCFLHRIKKSIPFLKNL